MFMFFIAKFEGCAFCHSLILLPEFWAISACCLQNYYKSRRSMPFGWHFLIFWLCMYISGYFCSISRIFLCCKQSR